MLRRGECRRAGKQILRPAFPNFVGAPSCSAQDDTYLASHSKSPWQSSQETSGLMIVKWGRAGSVGVCSERFIGWDEWTEIELGRGDAAHIHLAKLGLKLVRWMSKIT